MTEEHDPWEPDWDGPKRSGAPARSPLSSPGPVSRHSPSRLAARERRRPGPLLVLFSMLPGALLLVALLGVGLLHGAPPWEACLGAALLVVLPILGIGGLFSHHRYVLIAAMWLWPAAGLVAMPTWFPGQRTPGLSEGFAWLALPLGEDWTGRAARVGERIGGLFGDPALEVATPIERPDPEPEADPDGEQAEAPTPAPESDDDGVVVLPYEGDGSAMRVRVTFDGADFSEEVELLFDTGATFTTLDRRTLQGFGVTIPADAPVATFQTANGKVESPMLLLERVWLDDRAVEGVTVAVCDDCSQGDTVGLLGLNVTKQFGVSLDHELQEITLEPGDGADQRLDITHWLDIEGQVTRWPTGRVAVVLDARNRSPRPIEQAVVEVECSERSFAAQLDDIPASGAGQTGFDLPRGTACDSYKVILRTASWGD